MNAEEIAARIDLIAEIGEAADALDLMRRLSRQGETRLAISVRRCVQRGELDQDLLRGLAGEVRRTALAAQMEAARLFDLFADAGAPVGR